MREDEKVQLALKCPNLGELVDLYVGLSETADPEALAKFLKSAEQDPEHNITVEARSGSTLVGFLRAWVDQSGTYGVVYDIVVSPARRSEGIAERLLAHLEEKKKKIRWKGDSRRVAPNLDRHLGIVRVLYAIGLTFGYQKVVEAGYLQFVHSFTANVPGTTNLPQFSFWTKVVLNLLLAALGFLGIRIFWAIGNIRRYVLRQMILINPPKTLYFLIGHFPLLLLHAVLYFFLCRFFQDICMYNLQEFYVRGLLYVFVSLLILNTAWLFILRTGAKGQSRHLVNPELTWAKNNGLFAVLGLTFAIGMRCIGLSLEGDLLVITAMILVNNAVNFIYTGKNYILGDAFGGA